MWPNHNEMVRPPHSLIGNYFEYELEGILNYRNPKWKKMNYLVGWLGYLEIEATWEAAKDMVNAKVLLEYFERENSRLAGPTYRIVVIDEDINIFK